MLEKRKKNSEDLMKQNSSVEQNLLKANLQHIVLPRNNLIYQEYL